MKKIGMYNGLEVREISDKDKRYYSENPDCACWCNGEDEFEGKYLTYVSAYGDRFYYV